MKKTLRFLMFAVIAISVTFTSCKKSDTTATDTSSELTTHSDDQARFDNENDAALNDADAAIESSAAFTGRVLNTLTLPCDATIAIDSTATLRRIKITYNGTNCSGTRTRTGVVELTMPLGQHWRDVGAQLTATITNLKITRISDNKSITINGVHSITNVNGGLLINLGLPGGPTQIVHEIASPGMSVTFDNGTVRSWQVGKRRTFTGNTHTNTMVITTIGTHTDAGVTGIAEWGLNRFGNAFVTAITDPMVIRQDCGFRLTNGQVTHERLLANVVVTFGLDATGTPTTCPVGYYYYKLVWTGANGVVRTVILPY